MKTKIFTLFTAFTLGTSTLFASDTAVDGIYYDFNATNLTASVTYPGSDSNTYTNEYTGDVVIPESVVYNGNTYSVTSIGNYAFSGCSSLTSVTIPNSVMSIGRSAFRDCSGLTSVTIPNSVTSIGDCAFSGCSGLTSVTIPNSVTSIGVQAFYYCSSLTSITIPNSVTSIGVCAFQGCSGLTSITIPNSVMSIGHGAFQGCSSLTSIVVESGNTNYDSRDNCNAIIETATNTLIVGCQSTIIPHSVTSIGAGAFVVCSALTSVTIPNSVTSIGRSAFEGCSGLTAVTIPNSVTSIGIYAFLGCSGLTAVTIPNSVTSIGEQAFQCCSGLTEVSIGNSVTSIEDGLFDDCSNLQEVFCTSMVPPQITTGWLGYQGKVYVPCGTLEDYMQSDGWNVCELEERLLGDSLIHVVCNTTMGTVAVDTLSCNYAQISATPADGYRFVQWSDGNRENPRTLVVTQDSTFTAEFVSANFYGVTTHTNDPTMGSVTPASGFYEFGSMVTLTAVPCYGYEFSHWSNGSASISYTYTVAARDTMFTAYFVPREYHVMIEPNNPAMGSVTPASGFYEFGSMVTLTAVPNVGYEFVQWSDGCTVNPRPYLVAAIDTMFTAIFEPLKYMVRTAVDDPNHGYCIGAGEWAYDSTVYVEAVARTGYKFDHWSDDYTDNPRTYRVEAGDTTFTAYFVPNEYMVFTHVNSSVMGSVTPGGTKPYKSEFWITATPNVGYEFVQWSDGVTSISRAYRVEARDTMFTAIFKPAEYMVFTQVNSSVMGSVTPASGFYEFGSMVTLTAVPNVGYEFVQWSDGETNPTRTYTVEAVPDTTFTAVFKKAQFNVSLNADGIIMGRTSGTGKYDYLTPVEVVAYNNYGYDFVEWQDKYGNFVSKDQVFTFNIQGDTVLNAIFKIHQFKIELKTEDGGTRGAVSGDGFYDYGSTCTIKAEPYYGYEFDHWNDYTGGKERQIILSSDTLFTATFKPAEFHVSTVANNPTMGRVTPASGSYEFGSMVTLTAVPCYGYEFSHWSNGNVSISYIYTVEARDTMFTAYFAPRKYMVSLNVQDASCGTTNGSGMYDYGTVISLSAVANYGYEFSNWSDGCTDNPRILEIIDDVTLTAEFIAIPSSNKLQMLFIGDEEVADFDPDKTNYTVKLPYGTSESDLPTLQDISWIPGDKYQIIQAWQAGNSVVVTVTSKSGQVNAYVISFIIAPKNIYQYTVTTNSSNEDLGTTIGSNVYNSNVQVEIGAFAKEGAQFYRWNDTILTNLL